MKELIKRLSEACGPSGHENNVRDLIRDAVASYADEINEDVLGNVIVTKKGKGTDRKHLMLVAHIDEPGLLVTHIEGNGYLRVAQVGNLEAAYLVGQRVQFPNGTVGVVGTHHVNDAGDVTFMGLFLDIAATSEAEALEKVRVGDMCTLLQPVVELDNDKLVGKALDNRVGCAVAVEALKRLKDQEHDVTVVFTTQHGVGSRGVKPAAFALEPDFGLVLDGVRAGDYPGAKRIEVGLGKGVAVKVLDRNVIVPPPIKNFLVDQAEKAGIAYQLEVYPDGTSDAGAMLITRDGIPTGGLSLPLRYTVTGSEMVDLRDVEAAVQLTVLALQQYNL
ncbi:MAG TPA: M42 family peptidase [Bacilli bacterium]|nr:M42 family peptidase [Bacilli bacterium]